MIMLLMEISISSVYLMCVTLFIQNNLNIVIGNIRGLPFSVIKTRYPWRVFLKKGLIVILQCPCNVWMIKNGSVYSSWVYIVYVFA